MSNKKDIVSRLRTENQQLREIVDDFAKWTNHHLMFDYPPLGATSHTNTTYQLRRILNRYREACRG